jgi:hypothetical protein
MLKEYTVYITETVVRPVKVVAETPAEAEQIAEEQYNSADVSDVSFDVDPLPCQRYL